MASGPSERVRRLIAFGPVALVRLAEYDADIMARRSSTSGPTGAKNKKKEYIRLLLVDDHEVLRMGLRALLSDFSEFEIVGETGVGSEVVELSRKLRPDVVLLDLNLKETKGSEVCRELKLLDPCPKVLVLTSYSDRDHVVEAVEAGIDGYLLKDMNGEQLAKATRMVHSGQSFLDPAITHHLFNQIQTHKTHDLDKELFKSLSYQEKRVLAGVAEGWTNKEIGLELKLSDKTVKNYLSNAMDKLNISRRAQAAAFYVRNQEADKASED